MKLFLRFLSGLFFLLLFSCASQELENYPNDQDLFSRQDVNLITLEEAKVEVLNLIGQIGAVTRSGVERRISDCFSIGGSDGTRTEENEDALLYHVFNFEDNAGFAIASGDRRIQSVLCITENGNLQPGTIPDAPGIGILLSMYETEYKLATATDEKSGDTLTRGKLPDSTEYDPENPYNDYFYYGPWENMSIDGTLLPVNWDQGEPYNLQAPIVGGTHCLAGCGATAVAQVMAWWKKPDYYNGILFPWEDMTFFKFGLWCGSEAQQRMATLFYNINTSSNLNASYGSDYTSTRADRIPSTFKNFGYSNEGTLSSYNFNGLHSAIYSGPVIVRGDAIKEETKILGIVINTEYKEGHSWVIDQVLRQRRIVKQYNCWGDLLSSSYEYRYFVHCDWGYSGENNGWFYPTEFNSNLPAVTRSGVSGWYQYNLKMISGIKW